MIIELVESLIQRVKRNDEYQLDPSLTPWSLYLEVRRRGFSVVRGLWTFRGVAGGRLRFSEAHVEIRHRDKLSIGSGSVVEAYARLHCLSLEGFQVGKRVTIGKFAIVECSSVLWHLGVGFSIGDDSSVGDYCFVGCGGGVRIGSRVLMGQRVSIHSQNHVYSDPDVPIQQQGVTNVGVTVGDDCWLGSGSVILDGVELGRGCVVAAGAVVTHSFPDFAVIGGVPARQIGSRLSGGT